MPAIDFPSSPAVSQIYSVNNKSWQWNGTSWISLATQGAVSFNPEEAILYASLL